jgi:hypothetical protein
MDVMSLEEALRELKGRLEQESRRHPGLHHYWVQGVQFVSARVLERVADSYGRPLVEVTKWAREAARVDYSCLAGSGEQLERFKGLAQEARSLFGGLCRQLGGSPRHTVYEDHVAWLADLYFEAGADPAPLLSVNRFLVAEWPTAAASVKLLTFPEDDQAQARIRELRKSAGDPLAIHRAQALTQDVFTASAAMIATILAEAASSPQVKAALSRPSPGGGGAGPPVSTTSTSLDKAEESGAGPGTPQPRTRRPARPAWVSQAELIGPCGHEAFAELIGISGKHLYRLVKQGKVWKECGPSPKRFYFYHHDPTVHRKLREQFERARLPRK